MVKKHISPYNVALDGDAALRASTKTLGRNGLAMNREKLKNMFREKLQAFLVLWGIYLALIFVLVIFSVFFLSPVITYIRFGTVVILPETGVAIKLVKATVSSSFVLTVIMVVYTELTDRQKSS